MYSRILVPLENSPYDQCILDHIRKLARLCESSLLLIHVADGFAARNLHALGLRESEEMQRDRSYLEARCAALHADGFKVESLLAGGDPATEIVAAAEQDVIYGNTANTVRHRSMVPVLMVRDRERTLAR